MASGKTSQAWNIFACQVLDPVLADSAFLVLTPCVLQCGLRSANQINSRS